MEDGDIEFSNIHGGKAYVDPQTVESYRDNEGLYTTIYDKWGDSVHVKESLEEVDRLIKEATHE